MQNDVGWLQITMNDPFGVRRGERLTNLPRYGECLRYGQPPAFESRGHGLAFDELQD